jgi:hypothetical protein
LGPSALALAEPRRPAEDFERPVWTARRARSFLATRTATFTTHYSAAELDELITAVNKIDRSLATPAITLLRTAA